MWNKAKWLKLPMKELETKRIYHGDLGGRFAYYRCEVTLPEHADEKQLQLTADISANSRYRLWVNGQPVLSGPCKGDTFRQYYETVDLSACLLPGKNVFCAQVLYCDPDIAAIQTDDRASIYGVIGQRCGHRFVMEGEITDADGTVLASVTTGCADWQVWLEDSYVLHSDETTQFLGAVIERIDTSRAVMDWKRADFDASGWLPAEPAEDAVDRSALSGAGVIGRFRLTPRPIPLMYEKKMIFSSVWDRHTGAPVHFLGNQTLVIPPHTVREMIFDPGVHQNGYPWFLFGGGDGACVGITYFEKFGGEGSDLVRGDFRNGEVKGITDTLKLRGGETAFEPFWVRTFRFICLRIETEDIPLTVYMPSYQKTGYPLEIRANIASASSWVQPVWEMCVRTLENCMLETYMDCPYYEQLQFGMDTRLEALYTYAVSGDARLVRKALTDYHYGMQPEGLTPGKYPSVYLQILSTFSLHYIIMMWEYYEQTGDADTIRMCRGDADRILEFYDAHIGPDGLVGALPYWQFVDWLDEWGKTAGQPAALLEGPSAIINLMYAYALGCAEKLFAATGRPALAEEYAARRSRLLETIKTTCWDKEAGLYREGPAVRQFTQHAQAWAVANGLETKASAEKLLRNAIGRADCAKATFPAAFEWFRALEFAGMYGEIRAFLDDWAALPALGCTTCPETPKGARSECHAWSALPMYEMMRTIAGVLPKGIGWERVTVAPHRMDLASFDAVVPTPKGAVEISCHTDADGTERYALVLPANLAGTFVYPDGRTEDLTGSTPSATLSVTFR